MCQLEASEKAKFYDLRSKVCHRINEHNNSKPCLEKKYGKCPHFNNLFWLLDEFDIFLSELAEQHKLCMPAKADVAAHMQEGFA